MAREREEGEEEKVTKLLAVDLDGVLANFVHGFLSYVGGPYFEPSAWNFPELPRDKFEHAISTFHEQPNFWQSLPAYPRNCDAMSEFLAQRRDYDIVYLTARPSPVKGPSALVQTNRWLRAQNLMTENTTVVVVPDYRQKGGICLELDIDAVIDDHAETVAALGSFGINITLLNRPWNQGANLPRANTLKEWLDNLR